MNLLPFGDLPPAAARKFVPARVDWDNWDEISVLFDQLEGRAAEASDAAALEQWLLDWGELCAALDALPATDDPVADLAAAVGTYVALGAARQAAWVLAGGDEPPAWSAVAASESVEGAKQPELRDRYDAVAARLADWGRPG